MSPKLYTPIFRAKLHKSVTVAVSATLFYVAKRKTFEFFNIKTANYE